MAAVRAWGRRAPIWASAITIAASFVCSGQARAEPSYWRLSTDRLTVVSNSSAKRCERLAASIIRFEQILFELTGWDREVALAPLRFFSLTREDAKAVMLSEAERGRLSRERVLIHSKSLPGPEFDVVAIMDVGGDEPLQSALFLHGQGLMSAGPTRSYPAWFQLGVAGLLNGLVFKPDGTVLLNRNLMFQAVTERGERSDARFDLTRLLNADVREFSPADFNEFALRAREWAAFGLLTTPERGEQYREFALLMRQGAPLEEAISDAFGASLAQVLAEFEAGGWRKDVTFRFAPPATPIIIPAASPIGPSELAQLLQEIAARVQQQGS
jgi:hypothetical protein